jgi:organic radical activating enzyme
MKLKKCSYFKSIMVLGSSVCNLNCSYCYLEDQHQTNAYVLLNKEIQKAWKNGTYVENIKKVFSELGDPSTVTDLEIWGGEPLILMDNMIEPIKQLLDYFPNLDYINIPTNFTRINHLSDFIIAVENEKKKNNFNGTLNLHIQISLDAPDGELQQFGHPVKWEIYRKNIEILCQELSQYPQLEKVMVDIEWHSTMTIENIIKYLNTFDNIKHYCDEFNKLHSFMNDVIKKYNLNPRVFQESQTSFPGVATPFDYSIEDALQLEKTLYLTKYLEAHISYKKERSSASHIYTGTASDAGSLLALTSNPVCLESGVTALTIMYDGSICECPCDYILNFQGYWDWIKDNPLKRHEYREGLYKKQFYLNFLQATDKEKADFDWYIFESSRMNQSTSLHLMINFYLEMAKSGQINFNYYQNFNKLLLHLTQFNQSYSCPKDQLLYTHTAYMGGTGAARIYFNGIVDMAQQDKKDILNFETKGRYLWKIPKTD